MTMTLLRISMCLIASPEAKDEDMRRWKGRATGRWELLRGPEGEEGRARGRELREEQSQELRLLSGTSEVPPVEQAVSIRDDL